MAALVLGQLFRKKIGKKMNIVLFLSMVLFAIIMGIIVNGLYRDIQKQDKVIDSLKDILKENINNFNWLLDVLKMKIHEKYNVDWPHDLISRSIIEQEDNKIKLLYEYLGLEIKKTESIPEKYNLVKKK